MSINHDSVEMSEEEALEIVNKLIKRFPKMIPIKLDEEEISAIEVVAEMAWKYLELQD